MTRTTVDGSQILDATIQAIDVDDSIEKTANKGIILGYAPLDDTIKIPVNNLGDGIPNNNNFLRGDRLWASATKIISGNYVGNGIKDRAFSHLLNIIPKTVIISNIDGKLYTIVAPGIISYNNGGYSTLIWDSIVFYVPGGTVIPGANQVGKTYYWVAFG